MPEFGLRWGVKQALWSIKKYRTKGRGRAEGQSLGSQKVLAV